MITVIAGVNGAGKSSIAGAHIRQAGGEYFNPDEVARDILAMNRDMTQSEANAEAWQTGLDQLKRAIEEDTTFTFETTLGGNTVCQTLHNALDRGRQVQIFFVGLSSPELHIERVALRVANGGHDIPESDIRRRWKATIRNMVGLIPRCEAAKVLDNSTALTNNKPNPVTLFEMRGGHFLQKPLASTPEWAKPLASAAMQTVMS